MAFARSAFWRRDDNDDSALRRSFWRKTRRVAAPLPFAPDLLAAYYCAFDRATPLQVKATLVAAIAYFVLPLDAIPDVLLRHAPLATKMVRCRERSDVPGTDIPS
ncbi:MAG: DUF1232 domain-containing protein [Rhizobiales bacterium]|nr:DUF1232 domain-containing protein [Hyphomicrobiales bacterium]